MYTHPRGYIPSTGINSNVGSLPVDVHVFDLVLSIATSCVGVSSNENARRINGIDWAGI